MDFDFIDRLPASHEAYPIEKIDVAIEGSFGDPESLTEIDDQFYFRTGDEHYIVRKSRPNSDSILVAKYDADELRAALFDGLSYEMEEEVGSELSVELIYLDRPARRAVALDLGSYNEADQGPLQEPIMGVVYTWGIRQDAQLFNADGNFAFGDVRYQDLMHYFDFVVHVNNPDEVLAPAVSRLRAAAEKWKFILQQAETTS